MTYKQFLLVLALWFAVIALIFATPARGGNVPMVRGPEHQMCDDSIKDLAAAKIRVTQLTEMIDGTTNQHAQLVLKVEREAVAVLGQKIIRWRNENCKDA